MVRRTKNSTPASIPVEAHTHKDTRKNIPTRELRDFVEDEEKSPRTLLYPRDPSLDPQLVWKGKDEQDAADLAVVAPPIYIQEKIHPQAIVEDIRASARSAGRERQMDLFADFNGLSFEQKVEFYQHDAHWSNRMILGDSLQVMASLAEKEALRGKVQMIYLDPPYGIKFGSNWQVSTRKRDVKDGKAEDATRQPEQIRAFRDTWRLGVHSYLAYLRDRLVVARELLTESGSIFVQIGDENLHLVRAVMDEVLGSENWLGVISFQKTTSATNKYLPLVCDYLIWYAKNSEIAKYRPIYLLKQAGGEGSQHYSMAEFPDGTRRALTQQERLSLPSGSRLITAGDLQSASMGRKKGEGAACWFPVRVQGRDFLPSERARWKTNEEGFSRLLAASRVLPQDTALRYVRFIDDFPAYPLHNLWTDVGGAPDKQYVVETNTRVVERCLLMTTDPGDLVLDPTCGSGTTAYVAEQWGRRWITIDTSRVALALARTRLMAARFPYYYLADTREGMEKEVELSGQPMPGISPQGDLKKGFVYRRVPHVTLKSIANNAEIDEIHARWNKQLEPLRAKLNKAAKEKWEEWEIPREPVEKWSAEAKSLHTEWWKLRRQRQAEIDASIARRAETETLYDQPLDDKKRVRVTGPFTVESLSPHRVLSTDEDQPKSESAAEMEKSDRYESVILENLKASGVQNQTKTERLKFDRLEPLAGTWLQAAGEYTENGKSRRVAVALGPEHGTVGPDLVKEAAKEAVLGVGYDLLLVCGFAFDPHVSEETKRYGKLTVLPVRMNPDLSMGDELLKKTGSANLFMVFGEPDVTIQRGKDGTVTVEVKGVDVYDPTTGEIRSKSTDDIACWFIDTEYDGESFFVRHAYFTGAQEPYDNLKRALRAEVDESAWSALYSTKSRPFPAPEKGKKIAVKVINHYGDEVLKVFEVGKE